MKGWRCLENGQCCVKTKFYCFCVRMNTGRDLNEHHLDTNIHPGHANQIFLEGDDGNMFSKNNSKEQGGSVFW